MINIYSVPLGSYLIHSIGIPRRMLLKHQISAEGKDLKPSLEKMQLSEEGPMPPTICHVGECSDSGLDYRRPGALSQLFVLQVSVGGYGQWGTGELWQFTLPCITGY